MLSRVGGGDMLNRSKEVGMVRRVLVGEKGSVVAIRKTCEKS